MYYIVHTVDINKKNPLGLETIPEWKQYPRGQGHSTMMSTVLQTILKEFSKEVTAKYMALRWLLAHF